MATSKLSVELEAIVGKYTADLNRAADQLQKFSDKAQSAGLTLTAAFTAPLVLFARASVQAGAELDGLNRSMTAIEGSSTKAGERIKILNEIAKLPGLNFKDVVQGDVNLRSAGLSADLAAKSMSAFGNALGILGKTGALGNVNLQIQQMASKTQGFGMDLRILKEWVPQVGQALQQAFGTSNADAIAKMGNTGAEVIEKIVAELAKLPKATGGLGNSLENLDDAWFKFTGNMGLAIDKSVGLSSMLDSLSAKLTDLAKWFGELDPFWQKMIIGIVGITAVAGPLLFIIGGIVPLFGAISVGAGVLAGVFWPATLAFLAFEAIMITFEGKWGSFWEGIKSTASTIGDSIASIIQNKLGGALISISKFFGLTDDAKKIEERLRQLNRERNGAIVIGDQSTAEDIREAIPKVKKKKTPGDGTEKEISQYEQAILDEKYRIIVDGHKKITDEDKAFFDKRTDLENAFYTKQQQYYKSINAPLQDFIGQQSAGFDFLGTKTEAFFDRMGKSIKKYADSVKPNLAIVDEDMKSFNNSMLSTLQDGTANILVGFGEWAGAFVTGVKSFKDMGKLLGSIFGDLMMQMGKHMLVLAIAKLKFEALIKTLGGAAIPVALGIIAVGSALKAGSQSSGSSYQQVPINSVSNYQPVYTPYNSQGGAGGRVSVQITQAPNILRGGDIRTSQQTVDYGISRGFGTQQGF